MAGQVLPAALAQQVASDDLGVALSFEQSSLQEANALLITENAALSAEEHKLTRVIADERLEQQKIRAQSAEMRAELMLQRRAAAQDRRAAHMQLDLALGSLQREKEVSSSMARERDEHLAQQRHAAGRAHLLMEENQR